MHTTHGTFYPQHAALGNVTMLTDSQGHLAERYSYSVTDEVTIYNASGVELPAPDLGNRWMFTGREWLPELRLYDYRNRIYSPQLGRFLQTDPTTFYAGDLNLYRYVENDYLNYVDPYGEAWINWDHENEKYQLGRCGTWISPAGIIPNYIEDHFPVAHTFAVKHDAFVDYMVKKKNWPDILVNIPSMPPVYVVAVFQEVSNTAHAVWPWVSNRIFGE